MESAMHMIVGLPKSQLLFGALFLLTTALGPNLVFRSHKRRTGKQGSLFEDVVPYLAKFNAKEWLWMGVVALVSLAFLVLAMHAS